MAGNVTGHFTVPNLRELLTPLTQQVEEEIEREEEPLRRKQRKVLDSCIVIFILKFKRVFV